MEHGTNQRGHCHRSASDDPQRRKTTSYCASTGPLSGRCWQRRDDIWLALAHNDMFTMKRPRSALETVVKCLSVVLQELIRDLLFVLVHDKSNTIRLRY